ncbi:hypothetical protein [Spirosoma koreense]
MLIAGKKSALCRVGKLCLIGLVIAASSCQNDPVTPLNPSRTVAWVPTNPAPVDLLKTNGDQPPKDVGGGGGSAHCPGDTIQTNDDQPPKDVGGGGKGS